MFSNRRGELCSPAKSNAQNDSKKTKVTAASTAYKIKQSSVFCLSKIHLLSKGGFINSLNEGAAKILRYVQNEKSNSLFTIIFLYCVYLFKLIW